MFPEYRGRLTEGITYNRANNTLLWVDIIAGEVHRIFLDDGNYSKRHQVISFKEPGESIGAIGLTEDNNRVLICAKYGIAIGSFETKEISYFFKFPHSDEQKRRLRSNDGIVDPWGHLWIGVMTDFPITKAEGKVSPEGYLYRINSQDLSVETMESNSFISNGLAFSDDGTKFYWTDLLTFTVWQYDYDHTTNTLSNKKPLLETKKVYPENNSPEPDGLSLAADGHFYHAVFGTSSVLEYTDSGEPVTKFKLPAQRITCTAVGGQNDDELFITTAHANHTDGNFKIDPTNRKGDLGGFLFRVKLPRKLNSKTKNVWGGQWS